MKLLVVSNMYPTADSPVSGIFVHEHVKALRRSGMDARVVSGKPLWLFARHPRLSLRRAKEEFAERRRSLEWDEYDGVPVARLNYFVANFRILSLIQPYLHPFAYAQSLRTRLTALASNFPYEMVHTHTAFLDGRAGELAARFRKVPMVLTEHTGPFSLVAESWRLRRHTVFGMKVADKIVAVSRALADEIQKRLPEVDPAKILVLPNGVDTNFFDPEVEEADRLGRASAEIPNMPEVQRAKTELILMSFILGLRQGLIEMGETPVDGRSLALCIDAAIRGGIGEGPYQAILAEAGLPTRIITPEFGSDDRLAPLRSPITFLWVGHLVAVKRVDRLLKAFATVLLEQPNLHLRLLGGGELEVSLKQQAIGLAIADKVTFLPHLDRAGVRSEMARADCLVISSETETFGVVGIEALAMGLPVLSTDCGGPADYVLGHDVGELVENSTKGLTNGIRKMIGRLKEFDRASIRRYAVENYDFEIVARRLCELYEALRRS